jgi:hypothetical protein
MRALAILLVAFAFPVAAAPELTVRETKSFTHPKLGLTALRGEVDLPAEGIWQAVEPPVGGPVRSVFLVIPPEKFTEKRGELAARIEREKKIEQRRWRVQSFYGPLQDYANRHNGVGPNTMADIAADDKAPKYHKDTAARFDKEFTEQGVLLFLVPQCPIVQNRPPRRPAGQQPQTAPQPPPPPQAQPLLIELTPEVDDGKHYVLMSDGQCVRRDIDAELLKKFNLTMKLPAKVEPLLPADRTRYGIAALTAGAGAPVRITLREISGAAELICVWDVTKPAPGDATVIGAWASARALPWALAAMSADAPVLRAWVRSAQSVYGAKGDAEEPRDPRDPVRGTDVFNVLGGRAAIRETLQMQSVRAPNAPAEALIPIADLQGVQVKSHPYDEMVKALPPAPGVPLAEFVPQDRFFVYFAKPSALIAFLGGGSEFLAQAGALITRNCVDYNLSAKCLARLGTTDGWARSFLQGDNVTQVALILPDLFLIDGADMTVILRVPKLGAALPTLKLLGIKDIEKGEPVTVPAADGRVAYWAVRGDLLVMSSDRGELDRVLALHKAGGEGGLGRSAEFRYMLSKTPLQPNTTAFAYFSDAFIRRLVGPAVKIGQLRRLRALADLQNITAAALLYKADGQPGNPALPKLIEMGYLRGDLARGDYSLSTDLLARSPKYGTLACPATLAANPVTQVTQSEADAYRAYVQEYSNFWRQFFDPIAMRLDETPDGMDLTTFILPLLDSALYNGVRTVVAADAQPMAAPVLDPKPVLMLSLRMTPDAWAKLTRDILGNAAAMMRLDTTLFDLLGPSIHLAVQDSDPVIALGSGDLLGIFGGNITRMNRGEMFAIPIIISILTRPSKLLIELKDPAQAVAILRRSAAFTPPDRGRGFLSTRASFYKLDGRDAWLYALNIEGIIRLNFGIEVVDKYLVISNLPWSQQTKVAASAPALGSARLEVNAGVVRAQLPALYTAACEAQRAAAIEGIAYLTPFIAAGAETPADAAALHDKLLGFKPVHPPGGDWTLSQGRVVSTAFGGLLHQKQPPYDPAKDFGLLQGGARLSVQMQLEDSGLRSIIKWSSEK